MRPSVVFLVLALSLLGPASPVARGQLGRSTAVDPVARLTQIDGEIAQALSDVEQAEADGARVAAELRGVVDARAAGNRRLSERARSLYRLTRAGVLPVAGGFEAMLTHAARVARLERMLARDVGEMRELRGRADALREETGALATRLDTARGTVTSLEAEKARVLEAAAELSLFDVALGPSPSSSASSYGGDDGFGIRVVDPEPSAPSRVFESQRGQLALPLSAPTDMRAAAREEGAGLELLGTRGATVRAGAAGHVAYADRHPGYGSLVIIDHGGSYFTIYGGLGGIEVQVGDEVQRASHVGTVGTSPVFFQVRRGTRALDARAWLGI
jgi:septal ring factor EnvC (AmiA/AmiB activator)